MRPQTTAAGSFAQGFANGMNMGAAAAATRARKKIHHGCMLNLGWSTEQQPRPTTRKSEPEAVGALSAEDKWAQAIETFMDMEAASPGGIDYRNDETKLGLLDIVVKDLANDPKNEGKSMSWFLIEANRIVKSAYRHAEGPSAR